MDAHPSRRLCIFAPKKILKLLTRNKIEYEERIKKPHPNFCFLEKHAVITLKKFENTYSKYGHNSDCVQILSLLEKEQ